LSNRKQRLELTWIGKDERTRIEPRILLEEPDKSYCAKVRVTDHDVFNNILIHGDNLLALKALEQEYTGKVKCVFIDPPYNTGSAFAHYDDGIEHSIWLSLMRDRLELIQRMLSADGSLWISIDDNESHYLKVLCDEIFGRSSFVANVVWQKRVGPDNRIPLGDAHDNILVYAANKERFQASANKLPLTAKQVAEFKNPDKDPRGPWTSSSNFSAQGYRPNQMYIDPALRQCYAAA
jgi:adenine-specific DNA-methyltransferase